MTTVLCHFRVADYDAWREGYDEVLKVTPGVLAWRIWRGQDDPGLVMVEETFDTRGEADAAWKDPEVEGAMAEHGIDLTSLWVEYFEEAGTSGAH